MHKQKKCPSIFAKDSTLINAKYFRNTSCYRVQTYYFSAVICCKLCKHIDESHYFTQSRANSTVPVSLKIQYRRKVKISLSGKLNVQSHQTLVWSVLDFLIFNQYFSINKLYKKEYQPFSLNNTKCTSENGFYINIRDYLFVKVSYYALCYIIKKVSDGRTRLKIAKKSLSLILSLICVSEWVRVEPPEKAVAQD